MAGTKYSATAISLIVGLNARAIGMRLGGIDYLLRGHQTHIEPTPLVGEAINSRPNTLRSVFIRLMLLLVLLWPSSAYAYLDPATASLIVSGLIAALSSVVVAVRLYWARIRRLFRRSDPAHDSQSVGEPISDRPRPTDEPRH